MQLYDAVLEGGGTKIPGLVGALAAIEDEGYRPSHFGGTSAGAIVAALRIAGFHPDQLKDIVVNLDFRDFLDGNGFGRKSYNIFKHWGIYKGDALYEYIKDLLAQANVHTFGDLLAKDENDRATAKWRHRLKVYAADITSKELIKFPDDASHYGIHPDEFEVALAVRCSMSIPFFFRPVEIHDKRAFVKGTDSERCYLVDGGVSSNFPIDTFDDVITPSHPTFGLLLKEPDFNKRKKINGIISFFFAMFETMMKAHDKKAMRREEFIHRTIPIPVGDVGTTDFDLSEDKKLWLYNSGYKAAREFLNHWSWSEYVRWANKERGVLTV